MEYIYAYQDDREIYSRFIQPNWKFFVVKNSDSQAVALSSNYAYCCGYQKPDDFLGLDDRALKCPAICLADTFLQEDKDLLKTAKNCVSLLIANLNYNDLFIGIYTKIKVGDHILSNGKILAEGTALKHFQRLLAQTDRAFHQYINEHFTVIEQYPSLTARESQIYFLLIQLRSSTDISELLFISKRTVQHHIERIKERLKAPTTSILINLGRFLKYHTQVPVTLLDKECQSLYQMIQLRS
jgi:DNA-binding CsgD family transcriptional regulator